MSTTAITGAAGFIGSHLADRLHANGHCIVGVDDLSGSPGWENIDSQDLCFIGNPAQDCSNREDMLGIFQDEKVDTLVHCAANARESASQFQPHIVTRRNLDAYASTLSAAIEAGVKRVIVFSSIAVYGHQTPPFTEEMSPMPQDVYAINKTAMEQMTHVLAAVHGFKYVILRPYNVFGVRQRLNDYYRNVIGIWMNKIMRGEPMVVFGDGKQRRAFTCIDDITTPICSLVENVDRFSGQTYNIGGFEDISLNDLSDKVRGAMGVPQHPVKHVEDRPQEVKYAYSSPDKAVRDLHFRVEKGIDGGLADMAAWAKTQGPQDWVNSDPMEISSEKMPSVWR